MKQTPAALIQYLFFFTAAVLMVFGVNSMFRVSPGPNLKAIYMVYAILMFGDALAMLACGLLIRSRKTATLWSAATLLSLNVVLSIFDQFGMVDLLFVLLNIFILGLLFIFRREFLPQ